MALKFCALGPTSARLKNTVYFFHIVRPLFLGDSCIDNSHQRENLGCYREWTRSRLPSSNFRPSVKSSTMNSQFFGAFPGGSIGDKSNPVTVALGNSSATSTTHRPEPAPTSRILVGLEPIGATTLRPRRLRNMY